MFKTKFLKSLFIAGVASLALGATAMAQSTILTIDQARVMRDSEVGKHILRQMESIAKSMDSELQASSSPITSERDRLVNELKSLDADAVKSRPDIQKRVQDLAVKGQKQQVEAKYKQAELQITKQKAVKKVNDQLAHCLLYTSPSPRD